MRLAGSKSWRVSISNDQAPHVCLYVRDAFDLVPVGPDVPPKLKDLTRATENELTPAEKGDLSSAWLHWWRRLTRVVGAAQLGQGHESMSRNEYREARIAARQSVMDPFEGFASLTSYPSLQRAAQQTWKDAVAWTNIHTTESSRHGSQIPRTVAERVIEENEVSPERVNASVVVLSVQGQWAHLTAPGMLLCSKETFFDDSLFAIELQRAFESGLRAPG
jgi:hypothetical protein